MSLANDTSYVPDKLPFSTFSFAGDERSIQFVANSRRFSCDIARYDCSVADTLPSGLPYVKSPDGRWEAFSHEYNPVTCARWRGRTNEMWSTCTTSPPSWKVDRR